MGGEYMKPLTRGVVALALVIVLAVVAAYGTDWAKAKDKSSGASGTASAADTTAAASAATSASSEERCGPLGDGRRVPIATSKLLVEYNATDGDLGVHGAFDDDGWSKLCVYDPNGDLILKVGPQSQLKDLTMAGIFFESREPQWIHPMHGGSLPKEVVPIYTRALREEEFAFEGKIFGRMIPS